MAGSSSTSSTAADAGFASLRVRAPDAQAAERAAAEAFEAGAAGLEEREDEAGITLVLYAGTAQMAAVRAALAALGAGLELGAAEPVPPTDWSETWKQGLAAIVVSPRLVVRPSFVAPVPELAPGAAEVVIDPGQAFGTGAHVSTRLALEWVDALAPGLAPDARVLDAGCGSGVLALAALRLSAARAVAFDLDPLACAATLENARANGLGSRLQVFTGPLEALGGEPFALVLANLLSREFLPLLEGLARRTAPGGAVVFSGLLASERERVAAALLRAGLRVEAAREAADVDGEPWVALLTRR